MTWECAILKSFAVLGGQADNPAIYRAVQKFKSLTARHLAIDPRYGNRPRFVHQVRSHITNLCDKGELRAIDDDLHELTPIGRARATRC